MNGVPTSIRDRISGPIASGGPASLDCQTAFQRIAKSCARLIQRNRKSAIAADPEAIHTMRIELTRLRAAVLFFAPMTNDIAGAPISKELRWLNAALGAARDHDVNMGYARRKRYRSWARRARSAFLLSQSKSHRRLARKLNSARYHRLIVELDHWITKGSWLSDAQPLRSGRVNGFSQVRLREWRREISRDGHRLRALSGKRLHRLRINCKRYRYIVAALQALKVPVARQEARFCEIARQVHGALGDLRDLKRLRKAGHGRPPGYRKRKQNLLREAERPFQRRASEKRT